MKVCKLVKKDNGRYEVYLENKVLDLDEETILHYKLLEGKVVEVALEEILNQDLIQKYYNQALNYQFKYNKSTKEVINYLLDKEVNYVIAKDIVNKLKIEGFLDDKKLAYQMASSLARNSNGPLMIKQKLKNHLFNEIDIAEAIEKVSEEDFEIGAKKLYKKGLKQYAGKDNIKLKLKVMYYRHGYLSSYEFDE